MSAEKIKRFFQKKKEEAKFKLSIGGQGHKLNAPPPNPSTSQSRRTSKDAYKPPKRKELSAEARAAAEAAMARIQKKDTREFNTSLAAIKAQVKRELEAERKLKEEAAAKLAGESKDNANQSENKNLACQGVFFRCPLISEEILPKKEWKAKIKEFLFEQLELERGLTACLIIQNCNVKEKAEACVETLNKYVENLINHPDEEKFQKIRMSNRIFCEKVRHVEGAIEFLNAAGFIESEIDGEPFFVWSSENMEGGMDLSVLQDALNSAEPIALELDRNIQVLLPSQARRCELPNDFYRITPEEIKREQQLRSEAIENAQILKTKAMREREELRTMNKYRFALIRVKFSNGVYLQGTFNVYEKLSDVYEFVQSCLYNEAIEFSLNAPAGIRFTDDDIDKSLFDLRLIPNTVLIFTSDSPPQQDGHYLKDDLLMLIQSI